jgi:hypothetical protein
MGQTKMNTPTETVERNLLLTGGVMQFLMENPEIFDSLPEKFELVILPDDDPAIREYNLELLDKYGSEDKPIVFARITSDPENRKPSSKPRIFVPVPIAA